MNQTLLPNQMHKNEIREKTHAEKQNTKIR